MWWQGTIGPKLEGNIPLFNLHLLHTESLQKILEEVSEGRECPIKSDTPVKDVPSLFALSSLISLHSFLFSIHQAS